MLSLSRSKEEFKKEGMVAQLVEHRTENPGVGGSIPPRTTIIFYD